jgi:hypothetical protein
VTRCGTFSFSLPAKYGTPLGRSRVTAGQVPRDSARGCPVALSRPPDGDPPALTAAGDARVRPDLLHVAALAAPAHDDVQEDGTVAHGGALEGVGPPLEPLDLPARRLRGGAFAPGLAGLADGREPIRAGAGAAARRRPAPRARRSAAGPRRDGLDVQRVSSGASGRRGQGKREPRVYAAALSSVKRTGRRAEAAQRRREAGRRAAARRRRRSLRPAGGHPADLDVEALAHGLEGEVDRDPGPRRAQKEP